MKPTSALLSPTDTKKYGKQALQLDMGNSLTDLHPALLPAGSYFPKRKILQHRQIALDEAHLHHLLASWEGKTPLDKMMITASAMSAQPSVAFSVRFSTQRQSSLAVDPTSVLRKLRNELTALTALGPTMMSVERDKKGVLHLHGVIATAAPGSEVKKVLWVLGGRTESVRFRNCFQIRIKMAHSMCCWGAYMSKDLIDLPASEATKMIYLSQSATRMGEAHLPVLRDLTEQKLGVKSEWRGRSGFYSNSGIKVMSSSIAGMTRQ